ncbi:NADH-quinone oxidoreductase subunit N [Methanotrichaceae archaeon M04Ac]|uniref:NADH-quinone oxidoreductase subunit N n=1 Tax=Candidatus Methanocrinis alkalitolerans TaxID=3033395 RepID=A0ABT5XFE7_9EURY|nr:NADH-quinone oxidoreductase subunit N [Candidatus Methanocrinis alkalitolerans]MCR3883024.1 NADH-quinone oxidoreductase subunit N [Methanothrix sp.]MDF0593433.1 NADH-quinone oxidoreductase subunit N [Candidatus Methanocrinis alkalitolerans]
MTLGFGDYLSLMGAESLLTGLVMLMILLGLYLKNKNIQGYLALAGLGIALFLSIGADMTKGPIFFGTIEVDALSQFFKLIFISVSLIVVLAGLTRYKDSPAQDEFYILLLLATIGMMVVASSIDLLTLWIGFELASISTYAMAAFDKEKRNLEAAMKYFIFGSVSSAMMLFGFSILYGLTGSTRIAEVAASSMEMMGPATLVALLFVVAGFGFKMALVPFHMWAPDTYEGSPTIVTAFLAAGSKKMGFVAAFKVIFIALVALRLEWFMAFAVLVAITMTLGNVVAIWQKSVKRMLAYSSVAYAGYIAIAFVVVGAVNNGGFDLGVAQNGIAASLMLILGHAFSKTGAFIAVAVVGYMALREGRNNPDDIEHYAGLGRRAPITAFCMLVFLFSLSGIPPTAGFVGKFLVWGSAMDSGLVWLAVLFALNSALSLYYYLRVIMYMYMKEPAGAKIAEPRGYVLAMVVALVAVFYIGIFPQAFVDFASSAAAVLLH